VTFKVVLAWTLLITSLVATPIFMGVWYYDKINEKQMVGVTLLLSLLALSYSAVTTLFVV
jgi:hypothetical protein